MNRKRIEACGWVNRVLQVAVVETVVGGVIHQVARVQLSPILRREDRDNPAPHQWSFWSEKIASQCVVISVCKTGSVWCDQVRSSRSKKVACQSAVFSV